LVQRHQRRSGRKAQCGFVSPLTASFALGAAYAAEEGPLASL
jgi:hypothetical protein